MKPINKWLMTHPSFVFADAFKKVCQPLEQLEIYHFSHVRVDKMRQFSLISQNPVFLNHYLEFKYFHFDVIQLTPKCQEQYIIRDLQSLSGKTKQLQEDFNAHGLGHSFTLVKNSSEQVDFYNFATCFGNNSINECYLQNLDYLKQFISYFHEKINAHKELKKAYEYKLPLQSKESGFTFVDRPAEKCFDLELLNRIYIPGRTSFLTLREYECLSWLSKGKTQEQIALILQIGIRTVKAHVANIREKLGCVNQFQMGMIYSEITQSLNQFQNSPKGNRGE